MAKNENGFPIQPSEDSDLTPINNENVAENSARPREGCSNGAGNSCGGTGDCLDTKPLAYVYAPDQKFRMLYSAKEALKHGTLFEELYKPMEVYGRE